MTPRIRSLAPAGATAAPLLTVPAQATPTPRGCPMGSPKALMLR